MALHGYSFPLFSSALPASPSKEMLELEGVRCSCDVWWRILAAGNEQGWFDRATERFGMTGSHDLV